MTCKGVTLEAGYRKDVLVGGRIIVEIKTVEALTRLHEAQILTYLRLSGHRLGFLMNFNVPLIKQGLRRFAHRDRLCGLRVLRALRVKDGVPASMARPADHHDPSRLSAAVPAG